MRDLWLLFVLGLATGFISEKLLVSSQSSSPSVDDLYLEGRPSGDSPIDDEDDAEDFGSGSGSGDYFLSDVEKRLTIEVLLNTSAATPTHEMSLNQPTTTADSPPNTSPNSPTTAVDSREPMGDTKIQVPGTGPTADWFTHNANPSSTNLPPSKTTTTTYNVDILEDIVIENKQDDLATEIDGGDVLIKDEDDILAKDGRGSRRYEVDAPEQVTSENIWERTDVLAAVIACGVIGFLCAVFLLLLLAYRMKKKDEGSYNLGETKLPPTAYQKAPTKEFYA